MKGWSALAKRFLESGKLKDCPVYDMHCHMGPEYGFHFPRSDTQSMVKAMDSAGIRMLLFCHHAALLLPEIGNSYNVEAVRKFPHKLRAYCCINPNYPKAVLRDVSDFEKYKDVYVGFKFLPDYFCVPATDKRCTPAWELADEKGLLVLVHTWGGSQYDGPAVMRRIAEKYHNAKILLGHSCHGDWDDAIRLANDFPNVFLELCAVLHGRGPLELFVEKAGSEKIVFGTDFPWFSHHYYIGAVLGADITDLDRRNIFYGNAERLLRGLICLKS